MNQTAKKPKKRLFGRKDKSDVYLSDRPPLSTAGIIGLIITYVLLISWAVVVIWPLFQMVKSAFNETQFQYITSDQRFEFGLKHFKALFEETNYLKWVWNTIWIALVTMGLTVLFVSFTGYAYSRFRFRGKKFSLMGLMLIQTIPTFVGITAYYAMHQIISGPVPFFTRQMMLVLIYAGGGIAGNTFILKNYMDSVSTDLDDAAKIDGCSYMQTYRLIIMPIVRPMLAIIALWSFMAPFTDVLLPTVLLTKNQDLTLAAGLRTLISDMRTLNQPAYAAGGLLIAVPIVVMFMLLQKQLIGGLASGSVKG